MNKFKTILLIFMVVSVSSCASYYKAPANVKTAVMHFQTDMRPVIVQAFQDEECASVPHGVRLAYIDPVFVSDGKYAGPTPVEAGKLLVFTLRKNNLPGTNWSCSVTLSFTPVAGAEYVATPNGADGGKCSAKLGRKNNGGIDPVPDVKQNKKVCFDMNA